MVTFGSRPTSTAPPGMTSPVNELLNILLQMSCHESRREVQRIPKHIVKALSDLKAIENIRVVQQIVLCLRSDGDRICSQLDGQELHALLHVLLVTLGSMESRQGLHLLLEFIRKLTIESQRATRNVATTRASRKRKLFAAIAISELLGLFLGKADVEQRTWAGMFLVELIHDNEGCLLGAQGSSCDKQINSFGDVISETESYTLCLIAGMLSALIYASQVDQRSLANLAGSFVKNGSDTLNNFPALTLGTSIWLEKFDRWLLRRQGGQSAQKHARLICLKTVLMDGKSIIPNCRARAMFFENTIFKIVYCPNEQTRYYFNFVEINLSDIKGLRLVGQVVSVDMIEKASILWQGELLAVKSVELTFVDAAAAALVMDRLEQHMKQCDSRQLQSRALAHARPVKRHKCIAMVDLPAADRLGQEGSSDIGCSVISPYSESGAGKAIKQRAYTRPEQRSYACIDLPTGAEVFELSEIFLDTPPSTNCSVNPIGSNEVRSFKENADCQTGGDMRLSPKVGQTDILEARIPDSSGESDSNAVPSRLSTEKNISVRLQPLAPEPVADVSQHAQELAEQVRENISNTGATTNQLQVQEGATQYCSAAGELSKSQRDQGRTDATNHASPETVSENVQRHDNDDDVTSSSPIEGPAHIAKEAIAKDIDLEDVNNHSSLSHKNLREHSQDPVISSLDIQGQGSGVDEHPTSTSSTPLIKKDHKINSRIVVLKISAKKLAQAAGHRHSVESSASIMPPATATLNRPSASKLNRPSQKRREPTQWDLDHDDFADKSIKNIELQHVSPKRCPKASRLRAQGLGGIASDSVKQAPDTMQTRTHESKANPTHPGLPTPIHTKPSSLTKPNSKTSTATSRAKKGKQDTTTPNSHQGVKVTQATETITCKRPRRGAAQRAEDKIAQTKAYENSAWDISDPIESSYPGDSSFNTASVQRALQASSSKASRAAKPVATAKTGLAATQLSLEPRKEDRNIPLAHPSKKPETSRLGSNAKSKAAKSPMGQVNDRIPTTEIISDDENLSTSFPLQKNSPVATRSRSGSQLNVVESECSSFGTRQNHLSQTNSSCEVTIEASGPSKQAERETNVQVYETTIKPKADFGQTLSAKLATAGLPTKSSPAAAIQGNRNKPPHALSAISEEVSRFMARHVDTEGQKNLAPSSKVPMSAPKPVEERSDVVSDRNFDESELSNLDSFSEPPETRDQKSAFCGKVGVPVTEYLDNEKIQRKVQVVSFDTSGPKIQGTVSAKKLRQEETALQKPASKEKPSSRLIMPSKPFNENKPILKQAAVPRVSQPKPFPLSQVNENGSPMPLRPINRRDIGLSLQWDLSSADGISDYDSEASTYVSPTQFQEAKRAHGDTPMPKRIKLFDSDETVMTTSEIESLYEPVDSNKMERSDSTNWLQRHPTMVEKPIVKDRHAINCAAKATSNTAPEFAEQSNQRRCGQSSRSVKVDQRRDSLWQRRKVAGTVASALKAKPRFDSIPADNKTSFTAPETESQAETSTEEESSGSHEDQSITLVEPDSHVNTPEAQAKWQRALHASHQTTIDILLDISQRLVRHMISEEEAITKILMTYSAGCTRMIKQLVRTHQDFLKEYTAKAKPAVTKLTARCEEMRRLVEKDRRAVLSGQPSLKTLGTALGKRKRLHRRISDAVAKHGIAV